MIRKIFGLISWLSSLLVVRAAFILAIYLSYGNFNSIRSPRQEAHAQSPVKSLVKSSSKPLTLPSPLPSKKKLPKMSPCDSSSEDPFKEETCTLPPEKAH